jgi:xylulokinase
MTAGGRILSSRYREYAASRVAGMHEIDAEVVWEAAKDVIRSAFSESPESVKSLAVSSFGESCVLLDEQGGVTAPVMLYTDPRGAAQSERLSAALGRERIFRLCGHPPNAMYTLPKLMYIQEHKPRLWEKVRFILPIHSFIIYRLCGEAVTDYSLASRMMLLDITKLDWCCELLDAGGIDKALLPRVTTPGSAAGRILSGIADELGVSRSLTIATGCQDQIAAAAGAGALRPGSAVNGSGTVECLTPVFDGLPDGLEKMAPSGYAVVPAINGLYVTYAFIFTGGALLQWFRDRFAGEAVLRAAQNGRSAYDYLNDRVRPDPSGLLVLPHFAGAATPYMDTASKGAIVGLTLEHDETDVYRALLEGVAYESRINMERLESAGIHIDSLRVTGGGARSRVWTQIKADILNRPIEALASSEAGAVGSSILSGLAVREYMSLDEGMSIVKTRGHFLPRDDRARYDGVYEQYRRLYKALKSVYGEG